jgi:alpha-tubulin suppressor-like RCC1 family protein
MRRFFEPSRVPGTGPPSADDHLAVEGKVAQLEIGATHVAIRTACGRVYTYGTGTALGLVKAERKQWELAELKTGGRRALHVACGSSTTALILEP